VDKFKLASQALVLVGHPPIANFSGPSSGAIVANEIYDDTMLELLGLHRWRHATKAVQLARLGAVPATEWEAAYQIPADATIIHGLQVNGCDIEFDRFGGELHCNALATDTVVLITGFHPPEATWPPYFVALARLKLASVFAIPVAESEEKASLYEGKFVRQLGAAKLMDSQGRTASKLPVGRFRAYVGSNS
jgi:hypothetical protein